MSTILFSGMSGVQPVFQTTPEYRLPEKATSTIRPLSRGRLLLYRGIQPNLSGSSTWTWLAFIGAWSVPLSVVGDFGGRACKLHE